MSKPRVFVTRIIPDRGLQKVLAQTDATVWQEELPPPRATLLEWASQADGMLTLLTDRIDAELMDAAPKLKVRKHRDRNSKLPGHLTHRKAQIFTYFAKVHRLPPDTRTFPAMSRRKAKFAFSKFPSKPQ